MEKICKICGKEVKNVSIHIAKSHGIHPKDYYDMFFKKENDGICHVCGKPTNFRTLDIGYYRYCSSACGQRSSEVKEKKIQTCLERYGVENSFKSIESREKAKITKLERYGDENYNNREKCRQTFNSKTEEEKLLIVKKSKQTLLEKYGSENYVNTEKYKQTCLERYGVENAFQSEEKKNKIKKTCMERYGVEYYAQSSDMKEKSKNSFLKRYGVDHSFKSGDVKIKREKTWLDKYGVDNPFKAEEVKDKIKKTCVERYGVEYYFQSPDAASKRKSKYTYNGEVFDSSWELYFYIFMIDNGVNIIRNTYPIKYNVENKMHSYFPDFIVNGTFIEIKGGHLLDSDGHITNPFCRVIDDAEMKRLKEKQKCMDDNGVIVISDIDVYRNYVHIKYGEDYINQFKKGKDINDLSKEEIDSLKRVDKSYF